MLSWRLAGLGAVAGAITAGIGVACGEERMLLAYYIAPGLVFGLIIGGALWRDRRLPGNLWLAYVMAAELANAIAVWLALHGVDTISRLIHDEWAALALIGLVAGAVGGGLLGLASRWLIGARRWGWPVGAGALFGGLLPVLVNGGAWGALVFYVLWQAAFAAVIPATLENGRG
jgi:hypothetical protein